jgi:hypothetical protein
VTDNDIDARLQKLNLMELGFKENENEIANMQILSHEDFYTAAKRRAEE